MNGDSVCFSRKSDEWETPQDLFDLLDKEFKFKIDASASYENSKCTMFWELKYDSLKQHWGLSARYYKGSIWLNPPYSKIGPFIKKAYEESLKGATVVCLIPSRTDTKWWHEYVMKADEIRFIKGRLKFGNSKNTAPFPSCIVVFRKRNPTGLTVEWSPVVKISSMVIP